uniref:Uncharacterized protein MANES_13G020500 n=1 Tax=Rhizophora mucronata TaxID=61149 RepID=A0A2P2KEU5_RHIMU
MCVILYTILLLNLAPSLLLQIREGKLVCLYGGEDLEWIRRFTKAAQAAATAAGIQIEMLYVGKSKLKDKNRRNNAIIQEENLSHVLPELTLIWYFWVRLESMWHSKVQQNKTVENDQIMREIVTMLSFDGSDDGWAVISAGAAPWHPQPPPLQPLDSAWNHR